MEKDSFAHTKVDASRDCTYIDVTRDNTGPGRWLHSPESTEAANVEIRHNKAGKDNKYQYGVYALRLIYLWEPLYISNGPQFYPTSPPTCYTKSSEQQDPPPSLETSEQWEDLPSEEEKESDWS
jgi:hypothetical protein